MALRRLLHSKIHRATVTHADVAYEGSISIPPLLMAQAHLEEHEEVEVWNVSNGERFSTYTILGQEGSFDVSVNGAAAHKASPGDLIIIASFKFVDERELARNRPPYLVFVDSQNRPQATRREVAGPMLV